MVEHLVYTEEAKVRFLHGPYFLKMVKISLVTGASSGLGRSIAKLLCEKGATVYVVARSKDKLLELKKECLIGKGKIEVFAGDLTNSSFRKK